MFVIRRLQQSVRERSQAGWMRPTGNTVLVQYIIIWIPQLAVPMRRAARTTTEAVRRPAPLRSVCRKSTRKRNLFPFDETVSGRTCVKTGPLRTRLCGPATLSTLTSPGLLRARNL